MNTAGVMTCQIRKVRQQLLKKVPRQLAQSRTHQGPGRLSMVLAVTPALDLTQARPLIWLILKMSKRRCRAQRWMLQPQGRRGAELLVAALMTRATWNSLTALQVGEYVYNLSCADDRDQSMRSFEPLNGLKHMMANACVPAGHQYFCNIQESCMMANGCVISTFATYRNAVWVTEV